MFHPPLSPTLESCLTLQNGFNVGTNTESVITAVLQKSPMNPVANSNPLARKP